MTGKPTHGYHGTRTYRSWNMMKVRCTCKNYNQYHNYGGRGIKVCEDWLEFTNFLKDMGERPEGMTLDRIDNDMGYCNENCRWATTQEQNANKGPVLKTRADCKSGEKGIHYTKGRYRLRWFIGGKTVHIGYYTSLEEAITKREAIKGEINGREKTT